MIIAAIILGLTILGVAIGVSTAIIVCGHERRKFDYEADRERLDTLTELQKQAQELKMGYEHNEADIISGKRFESDIDEEEIRREILDEHAKTVAPFIESRKGKFVL